VSATRLPDWHDRLAALIHERDREPFAWGRHDCALWAADAHLAVTGVDLGEPFRGHYRSASGARKALRNLAGVEDPEALADKLLGERLPSALARLGDVVVADIRALGLDGDLPGDGRAPTLGVCYGRDSLFVGVEVGRQGLIRVPTLSTEHCYHG
jgi:hypothetical protein